MKMFDPNELELIFGVPVEVLKRAGPDGAWSPRALLWVPSARGWLLVAALHPLDHISVMRKCTHATSWVETNRPRNIFPVVAYQCLFTRSGQLTAFLKRMLGEQRNHSITARNMFEETIKELE